MPIEKGTVDIDKMDLAELKKITSQMTVDHHYSLKKARSPRAKRSHKHAVDFFGSLGYWCEVLLTLTPEQLKELQANINN